MTDTMTPEQRHWCMSRIRGKDTKPEMLVRRWLWSHGVRYRLHSRKLPGRPDIVIGKLKTVIFINGCFWHGHNAVPQGDGELANSGCCKIPHTNRRFWLDKINRNMRRDVANTASLHTAGWRVITLWECELKPKRREETLSKLLVSLRRETVAGYDLEGEIQQQVAAEEQAPYGKKE